MPDIVADGDNLGDHIATKSFKQIKGSDVASGDAVTLGFGGNTFDITGTTTINHINNTNWVVGSVVILHFDGAVTLTHNAGGLTGNEANILLSGDANFTSSAGDALSFVLHDSTNWVEVSRNVPTSSYTAPTLGSTTLTSGQTISTVAGLTLTSPTLTTPALGTPASGVATNLTGTASGLTSGNVITNANLTGDITSSGNATTITSGAVDIPMLSATGTASSSTYLRGDNAWATVPAGYNAPTIGSTSIASGATVTTIAGLTLTAPVLGTPTSIVLTNATGTASGLTSGNVTTNADLTGDITSVGNATTISVDAVDIPMLSATGTASGSTYLRGDNTWSTVAVTLGVNDYTSSETISSTVYLVGKATFSAGTVTISGSGELDIV